MLICFFHVGFKNILTIPLLIKNTRPILALAIRLGVPMTLVNEQRETPVRAPDKTSTFCVHSQVLRYSY